MPGEEDYLDGLLNSITQAKSDVDRSRREEETKRKQQIEKRTHIDPDDDFMDAAGLNNYKPERKSHRNLRRAFSESDFLKEFEAELDGEDAEDFLDSFDRDLGLSGEDDLSGAVDHAVSGAVMQNSGNVSNPASEGAVSESSIDSSDVSASRQEDFDLPGDAKDDLLGSIESIVSQAKRQVEEDDFFSEGAGVSADSENFGGDLLGESDAPFADANEQNDFLSPEFAPDALDGLDGSPVDLPDASGDVSVDASGDVSVDALGDAGDLGVESADISEDTESTDSVTESEIEAAEPEAADASETAVSDAEGDASGGLDEAPIDTDDLLASAFSEDAEGSEEPSEFDSLIDELPESDDAEDDFGLDLGGFDELDITSGEEDDGPAIMDESDEALEGVDLSSVLGDEFSDIGDMLDADESSTVLPDAQEQFEQSAEAAASAVDDPFADSDDGISTGDLLEGEEEKTGFLSGLIAKIKGIFAKKDGDEEDGVVEIGSTDPTPEELSAENDEILQALESEEGEGAEDGKKKKKKKKKKDKKAKKGGEDSDEEGGDAAPKEKKPSFMDKMKEKKANKPPKEPDNSPVIPIKALIPFVILAISICVLVLVFMKTFSYKSMLSDAQAYFDNGDYVTAYEFLGGMTLEEEDETLYEQATLLATLQQRFTQYEVFMSNEDYEYALDTLIKGVVFYSKNNSYAEELGVSAQFAVLGEQLITPLSEQFGLTQQDAIEIYSLHKRTEYTLKLEEILVDLKMMDDKDTTSSSSSTEADSEESTDSSTDTSEDATETSDELFTDTTVTNTTDGTTSDETSTDGTDTSGDDSTSDAATGTATSSSGSSSSGSDSGSNSSSTSSGSSSSGSTSAADSDEEGLVTTY